MSVFEEEDEFALRIPLKKSCFFNEALPQSWTVFSVQLYTARPHRKPLITHLVF